MLDVDVFFPYYFVDCQLCERHSLFFLMVENLFFDCFWVDMFTVVVSSLSSLYWFET